MKWNPEAMRVAMVWKTRAAIFVGACFAHCLGAVAILGFQTNCYDLPCVDSWFFDAVRGVWKFPLFYTPAGRFPAQDVEMVRSWGLHWQLWANAAAATAFYWGAWVAGKHARAWWVARRALQKIG
ncbi:hypothetical protein ABIE56_002690 [Luteibacter sp. 621]|jgi:hypothetical protein|uniref:hypothetical protein n=1 Tax=Luteibacter sp. 621 TaxID=3373916 RepID=UPI003D1B4971